MSSAGRDTDTVRTRRAHPSTALNVPACRMESACETCSYFSTGPEFVPVLLRQRDHARDHGQPDRAALFDTLITQTNEDLS